MSASPQPAVRIFVATRNRHKLKEIGDILGPVVRCVGLHELPGAPSTIEDRPTFTGNAAKKVSDLVQYLGGPGAAHCGDDHFQSQFVLADDSGLEVDALNGAPGVYSARFATLDGEAKLGHTPDEANNQKLLDLLKNTPGNQRQARFRCVLALMELVPAGQLPPTEIFEGSCQGRIDFAPRGTAGFGYDPLFIPDGYAESFAELGEDVKNRISHRSRALQKLRGWLQPRLANH